MYINIILNEYMNKYIDRHITSIMFVNKCLKCDSGVPMTSNGKDIFLKH